MASLRGTAALSVGANCLHARDAEDGDGDENNK